MVYGIFEVLMLLCFAAAWPFSIVKQWRTRSSKGKSILFSYIIMVGYLFGIANKVVNDDINYVLAFYILDLCLVLIDTAIYYRNTMCQHRSECVDDRPKGQS
jgi:hypothetical protein